MVSCLVMQFLWLPSLVAAKMVNGVTVTIVHIAVQKMIVETLPRNVAGQFVPIGQFFKALGYMLVLGSGLGLPSVDYHPDLPLEGENLTAYKLDRRELFWHFIYLFPVFVNCLMLIGYFCLIKADPIMYSIRIGDNDSALLLIDKVYAVG